MEYGFTLKALGNVLCGIIKKDVPDKQARKKVKEEYREILLRAKDIGSKNNLITSYALAAFFIAMNRRLEGGADKNIKILESGMRESRMLKMFLGNADGYFSKKKMAFRREWSKITHQKKYENDWVVDVIEKSDGFEFGFDYLECGVCKLCRDEGCFELAEYLCRLDFMLVELIGIKLERTMTLAQGCPKCDFRFKK